VKKINPNGMDVATERERFFGCGLAALGSARFYSDRTVRHVVHESNARRESDTEDVRSHGEARHATTLVKYEPLRNASFLISSDTEVNSPTLEE